MRILSFCRFIALLLLWPAAGFFKGGPVELASQEIFTALWNLARPGPVEPSVWARLTTALEDLYVEDLPESRGLLVLLELLGSPSGKAKEAPPWGFVRDVRRAVRAAVGQSPRHVSFVMIAFLLAIGDKDLMTVTRVNMPEPNAFRFDFDRAKLAELHGLSSSGRKKVPSQLNEVVSAEASGNAAGENSADSSKDDIEQVEDDSDNNLDNHVDDSSNTGTSEDNNSAAEGHHVGLTVTGILRTKGVLQPRPELFFELKGIEEEGVLLTTKKLYNSLNVGDQFQGLHIIAWDAEGGVYKLKKHHHKEPHGDDGMSMVQTVTEEVTETGDTPDGSGRSKAEGPDESGEGGFLSVGATGKIVSQKDDEPNEDLQGVEYGWDMPGLAYWMSAMSGDVIGALAFEFYSMHGLSSAPNFQALPGAALLRNPLPRLEVHNNSQDDNLEKRCRLVVDLLLPHVQVAAENEFYFRDNPIVGDVTDQANNETHAWIALLRLHDADNAEEEVSRTVVQHFHEVMRSESVAPERKEFARYLQYRFGIETSIDATVAGTLLLSAAEKGDTTAQVSVGNAYAGYRLIPNVVLPIIAASETGVDLEKAYRFWNLATQKGNPSARMMIAQTALAGKHPSVSDPTAQCMMALDHCRRAIFEKHPTPLLLHALAHRAHAHDDHAGALVLYSLLSEAGSALAARAAGDLWLSVARRPGNFVPAFPCPAPQSEDAETVRVGRPADCALAHFRRAGVLGNVSAMHAALAAELQRGELTAAAQWADRAAALGDHWGAVSRELLKDAIRKPGAMEELQQLWAEREKPTRQEANIAMGRMRDYDPSTWRSVLFSVLVVSVTMLIGGPLACLVQRWKGLGK